MSWYMNEERELLRAAFREFAQTRVRSYVAKMEEEEADAGDLIREMGELGFLGLNMEEEYGGSGPDPVNWGLLLEELGKESFTVGLLTILTAYFSKAIMCAATEEQKQKYVTPSTLGKIIFACAGTEPSGAGFLDGYQTAAKKTDGGWLINGSKVLITELDASTHILLMARTKDHVDIRMDGTMDGLDLFIIPTHAEGVSIGHIENKLGWKGSRTGSVYFDDVFVPDEDHLGTFNAGYYSYDFYGAFYGAVSLGGMEAILDKTIAYLKQREQYGASLWDAHEVIRNELADLTLKVSIFRNGLYGYLCNLAEGSQLGYEAIALKNEGTKLLETVASECMVLMGGTGVIYETGIERFYRDAKVAQLGCGSSKTLLSSVAMMI